jgi:hypothetical protein
VAGNAHHAAGALHDEIVRRALVVGTGLSKPGDGRVDDFRAARPDRVVAKPEAIEGAGRKVLDENVSLVDQPPQRLRGGILLEIEGDRALVTVD